MISQKEYSRIAENLYRSSKELSEHYQMDALDIAGIHIGVATEYLRNNMTDEAAVDYLRFVADGIEAGVGSEKTLN